MDHNGLTTHFAGWLCTPRSSLRLAGARSSPDRVEIAYTMLGDDPDAGHMAAQPDSSPDPPETLSEAPLLIVRSVRLF